MFCAAELQARARSLAGLGRLAEAIAAQAEAVEILRAAPFAGASHYPQALLELGMLQVYANRLAPAAVTFATVARENDPRLAGLETLKLAGLERLAWVEALRDDPSAALAALEQAEQTRDALLAAVPAMNSTAEQLAVLAALRSGCDLAVSLLVELEQRHAGAAPRLFELLMRRKALGLARGILEQASTPTGNTLGNAGHRQAKAIRWNWFNGTAEPIANRRFYEERAQRRRIEQRRTDIDWRVSVLSVPAPDALRAVLPPDTTVVEFFRYRPVACSAPFVSGSLDPPQAPRYVAAVLTKAAATPVGIVDLGPAETIDTVVRAFRTALLQDRGTKWRGLLDATPDDSASSAQSIGQRLGALLFDPLAPLLPKGSALILVPDGALNTLPFECLPTSDGWVADSWRVSYLDSTRQLLRPLQAGSQVGPALVLADPDFGSASTWATRWNRLLQRLDQRPRDWRHPPSRRGQPFQRLPASRLEGEAVARLLGSPCIHGKAAHADRLRRAQSPVVLHLATHAFALSSPVRGEPAAEVGGDLAPLLRAGLVFAGANRIGVCENATQSGLMTADEIAGLDLRGTELVVLSACETGLGEVVAGEGVLGLRRAFALAGARSVLISLWKIADLPTAIFMVRFYEALILEQATRLDALTAARRYLSQLTVADVRRDWLAPPDRASWLARTAALRGTVERLLQCPSSHCPYAAPYYWGGFVLTGESGPLPLHPPT